VLSLFPWTRGFADRILGAVLSPVSSGAAKILATLPKLIILALIVVATRYLLKVMRLFFSAVEHGRIRLASFEPEWAEPTHKIARILIIVFAIVVSYPYIPGSGTEAFKGITIFFGLLFSLGSSSLIANLIAGYTMTYRRAFHGGDRIAIGDLIGDVTKVRLMVTHLRSLKNEEVVIPNSAILNTHVINYSALTREHGLVLHTMVGIGYEVPWRQVEAMLLMAAQRTEGLLREPQPYVLQKSLGDFAVNYELNVFCDRPLQMYELYAALHRSILDVFNEFGIQIMTPAYRSDPQQPKVVPKQHWFDAPAQDETESGNLPRIEPERTRNSA
jgi:small-conductance mechanosensitive channel